MPKLTAVEELNNFDISKATDIYSLVFQIFIEGVEIGK